MNNEKGLTLIEIMAALFISTIVLGVAFMAFSAINLDWNTTTQKYNDDAQIRTTLNTVSEILADSNQVYYVENDYSNELRMWNGASKNYKVLYYDAGKRNLTLCERSEGFHEDDLSPCISGIELMEPESVVDNPKYMTLTDEANGKGEKDDIAIPSGSGIEQGELIIAHFYFYRTKYNVHAQADKTAAPTDTIRVKLLKDRLN
ncbi:hypothetical protein BEP19_05500 [Ammoniphilus oxalaticus]|uniref:Prepilin-type N-terminal cleavage/methylation domain-containing protein n=1 Tax=Ammoniphilus oxalaticus TaxID=66863 RepID=A0A419SIV4_9BACL|nr:prepilin-type N-terminal cleavage/methylation domain-containing protein [Ammoniphilus oxalaticus]RKD23882.1 hypothetical protein BEP19_05500 [Ammoniphilus oxalaticus]